MSIKPEHPSVRPAFPIGHEGYLHSEWNGLTKREYVAAHLLSGLLTHPSRAKDFKRLSGKAVNLADALLLALQETPV